MLASQRQPHPQPQLVHESEPDISFYHADRLEPGEYAAYCRSARVYRDARFQRWVCAVQFDIKTDDLLGTLGRVSWFLNLGARERPHAGRRGKYWTAWVQANGAPPKRRDRLSPQIFERRMARIIVGDVADRFYSVVRKIIVWET